MPDDSGELREDPVDEWFVEFHGDLLRFARCRLARYRPRLTPGPEDVVNEVWLKLKKRQRPFSNKDHFRAVAVLSVVHWIADYAKRTGRKPPRDPFPSELVGGGRSPSLSAAAREALERLAQRNRRWFDAFVDHHFVGSTIREVADHLGVSESTAKAYLTRARAFLRRLLGPSRGGA